MGQMNVRNTAGAYQMQQNVKSAKNTDKKNPDDVFKSLIENGRKNSDDAPAKSEKAEIKDERSTAETTEKPEAADKTEKEVLLQNSYLFGAALQIQTLPTEETAETEGLVQVEMLNPEEGLPVETAESIQNQQQLPEQTDGQVSNIPVQNEQEVQQSQNSAQTEKSTEENVFGEKLVKKPENRSETGKSKETEVFTEVQPEHVMGQQPVQNETQPVQGKEKSAMSHTTTVRVREPEEIPQKLMDEILVKNDEGIKEFEIHLEPENLGKIAVKILYDQGQTTVSILCSEKKTLDLLGQNAREIGLVMEQNLGESTTIFVEKQEETPYHQGQQENDHSARDSEQDRQREEQNKQKADDAEQFLQKLRLGLQI